MVDTSKCVPELHECSDGWRQVDRAWLDRNYPRIAPPIDDPLTDEEDRLNREVVELRELERERHADDVYPCPVHMPDRFLAWQRGDWPTRRKGAPSVTTGEPQAASGGAAKLLHDMEHAEQLGMPLRSDVDS